MKTVKISIWKGLTDFDEIPKGVKIIVKDYDIDGGVNSPTKRDENGEFAEAIHVNYADRNIEIPEDSTMEYSIPEGVKVEDSI